MPFLIPGSSPALLPLPKALFGSPELTLILLQFFGIIAFGLHTHLQFSVSVLFEGNTSVMEKAGLDGLCSGAPNLHLHSCNSSE